MSTWTSQHYIHLPECNLLLVFLFSFSRTLCSNLEEAEIMFDSSPVFSAFLFLLHCVLSLCSFVSIRSGAKNQESGIRTSSLGPARTHACEARTVWRGVFYCGVLGFTRSPPQSFLPFLNIGFFVSFRPASFPLPGERIFCASRRLVCFRFDSSTLLLSIRVVDSLLYDLHSPAICAQDFRSLLSQNLIVHGSASERAKVSVYVCVSARMIAHRALCTLTTASYSQASQETEHHQLRSCPSSTASDRSLRSAGGE